MHLPTLDQLKKKKKNTSHQSTMFMMYVGQLECGDAFVLQFSLQSSCNHARTTGLPQSVTLVLSELLLTTAEVDASMK